MRSMRIALSNEEVDGMILTGDALQMLKTLPDESVQCCITSPPYWGLRSYLDADDIQKGLELGAEKTPEEYVSRLVEVFREVRRVLRDDGTLWLNLGDSYAGSMKGEGGTYELSAKQNSNRGSHYGKDNGEKHKYVHGLKPKDLVGIPWRVAFALQADGWWLRQDIIWAKPNPMPESVTDRCTKSHEYIFLLTKSARYYYDAEAVKEVSQHPGVIHRVANPGKNHDESQPFDTRPKVDWTTPATRNLRDVWTVPTRGFSGAHFATFPPEIPERCIKAGSKAGDTILDPFAGSGTTLEVAKRLGRDFIGIELNEKYVKELIEPRMEAVNPLFA